MDGPGDELLAGAVLSRDEYARRRRRHALDLVDQGPDDVRLADDLVARLDGLTQLAFLLEHLHVLERIAERDQDAVGVEWLLEDVVGAELRGLDRGLDGRMPA